MGKIVIRRCIIYAERDKSRPYACRVHFARVGVIICFHGLRLKRDESRPCGSHHVSVGAEKVFRENLSNGRKIFLPKDWFFNILFVFLPYRSWDLLLFYRNTKLSEFPGMANILSTCCSGTYNNSQIKVILIPMKNAWQSYISESSKSNLTTHRVESQFFCCFCNSMKWNSFRGSMADIG